ncbi:MAG: STAS domain-containing protein [Steroidobacteraceae bacterium]
MFEREADGHYRLRADLTFATVAELRPRGLAALAAAAPAAPLTFDLAGARLADSAGLALLVDWVAAARARGTPLRFSGLSPELRALARLSDVEDLVATPAG